MRAIQDKHFEFFYLGLLPKLEPEINNLILLRYIFSSCCGQIQHIVTD